MVTSQVLLGTTMSSARDAITTYDSDPATFGAGIAVRVSSTGALTVTKAQGSFVGVSLGRSLSDHKKTAVIRAGDLVPLRLTDMSEFASKVIGDLTFTARAKGAAGNNITIALLDTESDGSAEVTVTGSDIVVNMEASATTAQAIKTAIDAHPVASILVSVEIAEGETTTAQAAASETALEGGEDVAPYAVPGAAVYVDDATGLANESSGTATLTGAVYASGVLDGVTEAGAETPCALVYMGGGL